MVVRQDGDDADRVFAALSDPTRRDIVARVLREEASVSVLASHYDMTFAAVQKHVATLERAGLVSKERRGREQVVRGRIDTLRAATRLLDRYEQLWRGRIARLEDVLAEPARPAPPRHPDAPHHPDTPPHLDTEQDAP
ncbi:metalloregulator ArsR/SmtB family transcription factor [uncultured Cellulomonas sp.]|uniref:ArsR/SmtB family transcription factor n=1 Tax=uncultured Cellulomonas sp. TaxID=189682 RepID=UPI00260F3A5F|nr:metalloregulator ArsR/SmtB family transcription factor [uncultured Cellulomonas sp.]